MGSVVAKLRKVLGPLGIAALLGSPCRAFALGSNLPTLVSGVQSLLSSICRKCSSQPSSFGGMPGLNGGLAKLLVYGGDVLTGDELRRGLSLLCGRFLNVDMKTAKTTIEEAVGRIRRAWCGGICRGGQGKAKAAAPPCQRLPTLLVLGNGLHCLPWEAALSSESNTAHVYARARSLAATPPPSA